MPNKGEGEPETKKQIVLVVDGRPTRQFYTSIFLQRLRYHVITAKTAEDALIYLDMTIPLAIITDIDLPGMGGVEFLRRVKQKQRTREVPVIIYSKDALPETRETCRQAGCAGFVAYPCRLDQLYLEVQRVTEVRPRRFVRLDTCLDVAVGDGLQFGNSPREDRITAISELGMFVGTDRPLPYGMVLPFTFLLPNAPDRAIRVEGQVLYQHHNADARKHPGMGVKFLKIGEKERDLVRSFIREKLIEGIAMDRANGAAEGKDVIPKELSD